MHAETFGALSKREKLDFILEQMRLMLAKRDYIRACIISKKAKRETLDEADYQDLKLRFYRLMIEYDTHEKSPFELAQHWFKIYDTQCVKDDEAQWTEALQATVLFTLLSPRTAPQASMLARLAKDARLEKLPEYVNRRVLLLLLALPLLLGCATAAPATTAFPPTCYHDSYTTASAAATTTTTD